MYVIFTLVYRVNDYSQFDYLNIKSLFRNVGMKWTPLIYDTIVNQDKTGLTKVHVYDFNFVFF